MAYLLKKYNGSCETTLTMLQERLQWQKNLEMNSKAQLAISQDTITRKDKHIDELNTMCKQLRDSIGQLENQLR